MKKILTLILFLGMLYPNISEARHHAHHYNWHYCEGCMMPNHYKSWHNHNGWWLPVGVLLGASLAVGTQNYYNQQREVYYTPRNVYYTPDYNNPKVIIIRDTNYPNRVIYETVY